MKWVLILAATALLMACFKAEDSAPEKTGYGRYKVPPPNDHKENKGF